MHYKPHILQKRIGPVEASDKYGRPIVTSYESWETICGCRCDDNSENEIKLDDGTVVRPDYHVVCDGNAINLTAGDYVRCLREDGSVRGEGTAKKVRKLNYLQYADFYI